MKQKRHIFISLYIKPTARKPVLDLFAATDRIDDLYKLFYHAPLQKGNFSSFSKLENHLIIDVSLPAMNKSDQQYLLDELIALLEQITFVNKNVGLLGFYETNKYTYSFIQDKEGYISKEKDCY